MKKILLSLILTVVPMVIMSLDAAITRIDIGLFSQNNLTGWETKSFKGKTRYALAEESGKTVLKAESSGTASGLYRKVRIDLKRTPVLNWSWKTDRVFQGVDERTKRGDDYPARVYVVFSGGIFFWRTRAINYVWSSSQPAGTRWPNAYTGNARMVAVESGAKKTGEWVTEKRNVLADFRTLFGEEPGYVDAVAIMTDTDNSGLSATSWYGDVWFSVD